MASSGREMHAKYFASANVITEVKKETFVYAANNQKIGTLAQGTPILVVANTIYSTKFEIRYGDEKNQAGYISNSYVRKPYRGGASERLQIKARDLVQGGDVRWFEGTEVAWFDSKVDLIKSMMDGLSQNANLRPSVLSTVERVINAPAEPFDWGDATTTEINEIGKYGGEFFPHLLWHDVKASAFPIHPAYPIIDSFIIHSEGKTSGLSSKFGEGAKASLFTLIYRDDISENCIFKTLASNYMTSERAMTAVYETGFQEIIPSTGADPMSVYNSLRNKETPLWLELFRPSDDPAVAEHWPMSLTAYFSRSIAKRLNECEISQRWLNKTINTMNTFQVNLDIKDWKLGRVNLDVKSFKNCRVYVTGSKSAIKDVTAKQGLLNYELRRTDIHP